MAYISPAVVRDLSGLPPTFLDTGELDLFCRENMTWANRSAEAGVPVEFHLYPGVNHGFDLIAPTSDIAISAMKLRCNAIRRMVS